MDLSENIACALKEYALESRLKIWLTKMRHVERAMQDELRPNFHGLVIGLMVEEFFQEIISLKEVEEKRFI